MTGFRTIVLLGLWLLAPAVFGQPPVKASFLETLIRTYHVEIAVAPELIPTLDSLRNSGKTFATVEEFLSALLDDRAISFEIIDGDKIMLRRKWMTPGAEAPYVLHGQVLSAEDQAPLSFATVVCLPEGAAVNAGEDGRFELFVSDVSGLVQVNYLGYQSVRRPARDFLAGEPDIHLSIDRIPLRQVTIVVPFREIQQAYDHQSVDLTGYTFLSTRDLLSWSADRLLLGMTMYTAFSGEQGIRIRGSDPGNSLFLLDGVPAYDPSHFYNIFSPYNPVYFSRVQIYKNNFPIEYGGRIDGLLKADREPRPEKAALIIDSDLLQSGFTGEVSSGPDLRLSAGARISHTGILNEALGDSSTNNFVRPFGNDNGDEWTTTQRPQFDFYDINARLEGKAGKEGKVTFGFFNSRDKVSLLTSSRFDLSAPFQEVLRITQVYSGQDMWTNSGVSASFDTPTRIGDTWSTSGYYSRFTKNVVFSSTLSEQREQEENTIQGSGFQRSRLDGAGIRTFTDHRSPGGQNLRAGVDLAWYAVDFEGLENQVRYIAQAQQELESTVFGQYSLQPAAAWHLDLGARLSGLLNAKKIAFLPAIGIRHELDQHITLRGSWSMNLQPLRTLTTEDRFGRETDYLVLGAPDKGYPILRSSKFMAGIGYTQIRWAVDIEGYYKQSEGFIRLRPTRPDPSYGDLTSPEDYYQLFSGEGWTAGVDVTVLYKHKAFDLSLLYTLSRMWERYDDLFRGEAFSPQEDRRHQIKLQGQYRFGKFIASGLLSYKSRAPYLSFADLDRAGGDGIGQARGMDVFRYLPPYVSLDLGLDYTFSLLRLPVLLGASVINLTDHENLDDILHLGRIPREMGRPLYLTQQVALLGRTGNARLRVIF